MLEAGSGEDPFEEVRPTYDLKRARSCIWEGKEGCVLSVALPQPVAILPWDVTRWACSPTEGCQEAPAHTGDLSGVGPTPCGVWHCDRLAVTT
jgi:hypothetical protein